MAGDTAAFLEVLRGQMVRPEPPLLVCEGRHTVEAALAAGVAIPGLAVAESSRWEPPAGLAVHRVDDAALATAMGYDFHRGVVALARMPERGLAELENWMAGRTDAWCLVLCPCLADAANAGAIVRNAAALGAQGVVFGLGGACPFARKAVRASSGAIFRLPVWQGEAAEVAAMARREGVRIVGTALGEASVPLSHYRRPPGPMLLVTGPEAEGLDEAWQDRCHDLVSIPMAAGMDSLNAAASTAVFLWELLHRGIHPDPDPT